MCTAYTLPPDLTDAERAVVEAFRRPADERAALAVRVRREFERLRRQGHTKSAAADVIAGDRRFPVTPRTVRRIVEGRGVWGV